MQTSYDRTTCRAAATESQLGADRGKQGQTGRKGVNKATRQMPHDERLSNSNSSSDYKNSDCGDNKANNNSDEIELQLMQKLLSCSNALPKTIGMLPVRRLAGGETRQQHRVEVEQQLVKNCTAEQELSRRLSEKSQQQQQRTDQSSSSSHQTEQQRTPPAQRCSVGWRERMFAEMASMVGALEPSSRLVEYRISRKACSVHNKSAGEVEYALSLLEDGAGGSVLKQPTIGGRGTRSTVAVQDLLDVTLKAIDRCQRQFSVIEKLVGPAKLPNLVSFTDEMKVVRRHLGRLHDVFSHLYNSKNYNCRGVDDIGNNTNNSSRQQQRTNGDDDAELEQLTRGVRRICTTRQRSSTRRKKFANCCDDSDECGDQNKY